MKFQNLHDRKNEHIIFELLRLLTKKQLKEVTKFINYKATPALKEFWTSLYGLHPKYVMDEQEIAMKFCPKSKNKNKTLKDRLNALNTIIRDYLAIQEFKQRHWLFANTTAAALTKAGAVNAYKKQKITNNELINDERIANTEIYHSMYQKELLDFYFVNIYAHRESTDSLKLAMGYQDLDFLVKKLKYFVFQKNSQSFVETDYDDSKKYFFLNYLETIPFQDKPIIQCYYLLLLAFQDIEHYDNFNRFKEYLFQHLNHFGKGVAGDFFTFATNICSWNIMRGHLHFVQDRFELTKIMVEKKFFFENDKFSHNHFRTIMRASIDAEQLAWTERFFDTYFQKSTGRNKFVSVLNQAALFFAKGQYDKLKECFALIEQSKAHKTKDEFDNIELKMLALKLAFVELGTDPIPKKKTAFEKQVNRYLKYVASCKKISKRAILSRINFGKCLQLIFSQTYKDNAFEINLREEVIALKPVSGLPWLLSRCDEASKE